jgi:acyl-CoA thioester hydrolase
MKQIRWALYGMVIIYVILKMAGKRLDFYKQGYVVPVVSVTCEYKLSLRYGDNMVVETRYVPCDAAKIVFHYNIYNAATGKLVAKGSSVQVFLDKEKSQLQLTNPPFFEAWKSEHAMI